MWVKSQHQVWQELRSAPGTVRLEESWLDYYETNYCHVVDIKGLEWMGRKGKSGNDLAWCKWKCQRWTALTVKVLSILTWIVAMTQPTRRRQRCKPCGQLSHSSAFIPKWTRQNISSPGNGKRNNPVCINMSSHQMPVPWAELMLNLVTTNINSWLSYRRKRYQRNSNN